MYINPELINFIKSDKKEIVLEDIEDGDPFYFYKEEMTPPICFVYTSPNTFEFNRRLEFVGAFNSDTGEYYHLNTNLYIDNVMNFSYDEKKEINHILKDIREEIIDKVKEKLEKETKFEEKDIDDYIKNAEHDFICSSAYNDLEKDYSKYYKFSFSVEEVVNKKTIIEYVTNKEQFLEDITNKYCEKNKENFKGQYYRNEAIKKVIEKYKKDPLLKRKIDIYNNILFNDKYKSFNINFKDANGNTQTKNIKKEDIYPHQLSTKYSLFIHEKFCDIPIAALDSITWKRNKIFDNNKYEKVEITKDELNEEYLKTQQYQYLSNEKLGDKEFMLKLIAHNEKIATLATSELCDDMDFIEKFYNLTRRNLFTFGNWKEWIWLNKKLAINLVDYYMDNSDGLIKKDLYEYVKNVDIENFSDEKIKKLLNISNGPTQANILNKLPEEKLNSTEFYDLIKDLELNCIYNDKFFKKFTNKDMIKLVFDSYSLLCHFESLPTELQNDKLFLMDIIQNTKEIYSLDNIKLLIDMYKDDDLIIHEIAKKCDKYACKDLANQAKLNIKDDDELCVLISENINFLHLINNDKDRLEKMTELLLCSFEEVEKIIGDNKDKFCITLSNYDTKIELNYNAYSDIIHMEMKDKNNHAVKATYNISSPIIQGLVMDISERFPEKNIEDIEDLFEAFNEKEKELER